MNARPALLAAASALVAVLAVAPPAVAAPAPPPRLTPFNSCAGLRQYARRHALSVGPLAAQGSSTGRLGAGVTSAPAPTGAPVPPSAPVPATATGGTPATPGVDYSATNVQEPGVDEPDVVKTDGSTIFAAVDGTLRAVATGDGAPRLLGSLALGPGGDQRLLLDGDRLLVISGGGYPVMLMGAGTAPVAPYPGGSVALSEVDVSNPRAMRVLRSLTIDGRYVDARLTGSSVRLVVGSTPQVLQRAPLAAPSAQGGDAAYRAAIRRARTTGWIPTSLLRRRGSRHAVKHALVHCGSVRRPRVFSGFDMLTVLTIDLDRGLAPVDSDAVMTDAETVYASPGSLYVATPRYLPAGDQVAPAGTTTTIHAFDTSDPDRTVYRASGSVPGFLLNQFSMSEEGGYLRVASTDMPVGWEPAPGRSSQSHVTVLTQRGDRLAVAGQVDGLGRGERIYAVRFIGDVGYVVTFRQVDPLYTLDLSSPAHPRVAGELKLLGYSAYLHPLGDGLLLGVGRAATDQGLTTGTQVSLFDVSDPAAPALLDTYALGNGSSSEVDYDHHAFLYWPPTGLAVLPVQIYQFPVTGPPVPAPGPLPPQPATAGSIPASGSGTATPAQAPVPAQPIPVQRGFVGAVGLHVGRGGIVEAGRVTHGSATGGAPILRSLVAHGRLYTVSSLGVEAGRLDTLAPLAFAPFPQPSAG